MTRTHTKTLALAIAFLATIAVQGSMLAGFDAMATQAVTAQSAPAVQASAVAQPATIIELPRVVVTHVRG